MTYSCIFAASHSSSSLEGDWVVFLTYGILKRAVYMGLNLAISPSELNTDSSSRQSQLLVGSVPSLWSSGWQGRLCINCQRSLHRQRSRECAHMWHSPSVKQPFFPQFMCMRNIQNLARSFVNYFSAAAWQYSVVPPCRAVQPGTTMQGRAVPGWCMPTTSRCAFVYYLQCMAANGHCRSRGGWWWWQLQLLDEAQAAAPN